MTYDWGRVCRLGSEAVALFQFYLILTQTIFVRLCLLYYIKIKQTISFPECKELFLEDCLAVISTEMINLGMLNYTEVIHEKRNLNQAGYNKVVIITDLSAELVTGKNHDGKVTFPFFWEEVDPATSVMSPRMVGVDGKFDCLHLSPEACCAKIQEEVPLPDAKGNYLQCHIFVPYGGAGNNKRDDRVIINLSPDGRVQESPVIE